MTEGELESIKTADIRPEIPQADGTVIVLQRHEEYIRKPKDDPKRGSLTEEAAMRARAQAEAFFNSVFENIPTEERSNTDILVVASDTRAGKGRRSMETAAEALAAAYRVIDKKALNKGNILNESGKFKGGGGVRPTHQLREPLMFEQSPEYVDFLIEQHGPPGPDFFKAFEEDTHKDVRESMGAEGPLQIADRLNRFVGTLEEFSKRYHRQHPGRKLIIWAATHYDTISPWVKRDVMGMTTDEALKSYLPVDYGAGITINIDPQGTAKTKVSGNEYTLTQPSVKETP